MFASDRFVRCDELVGLFAQAQVAPKRRRVMDHTPNISYLGSNEPMIALPIPLCLKLHQLGLRQHLVFLIRDYMVMRVYGKKHLQKTPVDLTQLLPKERSAYCEIRKKLANPLRKQRLESIMNSAITKRLIHFFVVHYVLLHNPLSYWLDKRQYPYKILGDFNKPNQPDVVRLMNEKAFIVYINIHNEYRLCKNNSKLIHAPYARSVSVKDEFSHHSLTEWNFYLWLDEIGGFEAFERVEHDVKLKKQEYENSKKQHKPQHLAKFKPAKQMRAYELVNPDF